MSVVSTASMLGLTVLKMCTCDKTSGPQAVAQLFLKY